MKILIAADMEGITGVTRWEETDPAHPDYARFRKIMTDEVNQAIMGAAEGGADEIMVADGHDSGTNILIEDLDKRVKLNSGNASHFAMMQGIDKETQGVIFIGYHARAGSMEAVLAHTWSSGRISEVRLNDVIVGEYGLNAALAGHFGVPVIMVSGDQTTCSQVEDLLGPMETVVVKRSSGYFSAECLPPSVTLPLIRVAASHAVRRQILEKTRKPYLIKTPVTVAVEFLQPQSADRVERLPYIKRLSSRQVMFTLPDMPSAYNCFRAAVKQSYD
jgi:D-amino peptidase